jgi:hypothetical protein
MPILKPNHQYQIFFRIIANEGANIQRKIGANYLGYLPVAPNGVEQLNTGKNWSRSFFTGLKVK